MIDFEQAWATLGAIVEPEHKHVAKLFWELGRCLAMEHAAQIESDATLAALADIIKKHNSEITKQ